MKRSFLLFVLVVFTFGLVSIVFAGGAADKATGSGMWTNQGGHIQTVEFNAHEARDGRPAKGNLYQVEVDGAWTFTVDVDDVYVDDNGTYACFGGEITQGTGLFKDRVGMYRWTVVIDDSESVGNNNYGVGDYLRGDQGKPKSPPSWCMGLEAPDTVGNHPFSEGNIQIHLGKSYE